MSIQTDNVNLKPKVRKPLFKFLIGFIGGLCAALFPRLMAAMALFDSNNILLLNTGYLCLAVLFAALIGGVIMIMEWGEPKEPRATFMAALGLPALLSGALNTSNGVYMLNEKASENIELTNKVQELSNIPVVLTDEVVPLSFNTENNIDKTSPLAWAGIDSAYADDGKQAAGNKINFNPSIQVQQHKYYVILEQAQSAADANDKVKQLKLQTFNSQAVKVGDRYYLIDPVEKSKTEAVLQAIRLKAMGHNPALLEKK